MAITDLLQLTIGLKGAAGDANTAENGRAVQNYQVLPLVMMGQQTGFALNANNLWIPQIPALKGGGSWADTVLYDGRRLQSEAVGNVQETIPLIINGGTWGNVHTLVATLNRFIQNARRFTASNYQIQPVHLNWQAQGSPDSQWALVYSLDIAIDPQLSTNPAETTAVLTLEREPYWRPFPVGSNPKLWSFYSRNQTPTVAQLDLLTTGGHLVEATINNRHEWTPTGGGAYLTPLSKNYIEISGDLIPGDAPALVEFSIGGETPATDLIWDIWFGRSSKVMRTISSTGVERAESLILNAGDANTVNELKTVTKVIFGSSNGSVFSNGSSVNRYYVNIQMPASNAYNTLSPAIEWVGGTTFKTIDKQLMRGRYAVFIRGGQFDGAAGDTFMRFVYQEPVGTYGDPVVFISQEVQVGFSVTTNFLLHYMGEITIPYSNRVEVGTEGRGLEVLPPPSTNAVFGIDARNANGAATRNVRIVDFILIPIDECSALIQTPRTNTATPGEPIVYDNTGYLNRGALLDTAIIVAGATDNVQAAANLYSNTITLLPRTDQRLFFIVADSSTSTPSGAQANKNYIIRLNIIPRWTHARDV